jgi:hypothetical protein
LLGTTSRTGSYVRALEARLKDLAATYNSIDGIVAVAHTEGGGDERPNNLDLLLRTLAGFMVHPNVGAVLAVVTIRNAAVDGPLVLHGHWLFGRDVIVVRARIEDACRVPGSDWEWACWIANTGSDNAARHALQSRVAGR